RRAAFDRCTDRAALLALLRAAGAGAFSARGVAGLGEYLVGRRADAGAGDRLALGLHDAIEIAERVLELILRGPACRCAALAFRPCAAAGVGRAARTRTVGAVGAFCAAARAGRAAACDGAVAVRARALTLLAVVRALLAADAVFTLRSGRTSVLPG